MPETVQKRRNFIVNLLYFALILSIIYVSLKYFFWTVSPFLLSLLVATALQKPIRAIERKTKVRHGLLSCSLVVLVIFIILGPLAALLGQLVSEVTKFVHYIVDNMNDIPAFVDNIRNGILKFLQFLPDGIYTPLSESIQKIATELKGDFNLTALGINPQNILNSLNGVYNVAKNVPDMLLTFLIGIVSLFFMTKDYSQITSFIRRQLPENKQFLLPEVKNAFFNTIGKMLRSYAILMFLTFCQVFFGLTILNLLDVLNNDYVFVISIGISIFDILPVLGAGGVLLPWALYGLVTGDVKLAIGMVVIYAIVLIFRQYLEPKIVGTQLGVHPLVTLAGLYFGLKLFGFIGIFIVPLAIMILKALNDSGRISVWKRAPAVDTEASPISTKKRSLVMEKIKNMFKKK